MTATSASASNDPPYRTLVLIKATNPSTIPSGAIVMFDAAPTAGSWTRYNLQDNSYIKLSGTAGTTGTGAHIHGVSYTSPTGSHTGTAKGNATQSPAGTTHTHTISGTDTSSSLTFQPSYREVLLYKASANNALSNCSGMIAFFDATPTLSGWSVVSGVGSVYENRFPKPVAAITGSGGGGTHTHTVGTRVTGGPSTTSANTGNGAGTGLASSTHTHTITTTFTDATEAESTPPYVDFLLAKYTPPSAPTVSTPTATGIGSISATLGATVDSNGGDTLTARGTVWGTATNPTGNAVAEGGTTVSGFTHSRNSLTAGTLIYYRGYATNSIGTSYSPNGSFYTEPATQASNVTFSGVSPTGMTVNWTRGSGDGVVVLMKETSAVTGAPADGTYTAYTANSAFGSGTLIGDGRVVYKGTGTNVAVTGLTGGTTYYVSVFEYKGTVDTSGVDQGTNYVTSTPATGNQIAQAPADVTSPSIGAITVSPTSGSYTSSSPTIYADAVDAESTVTTCEYTTNGGTNWYSGSVAPNGANTWRCTATPTGLSGSLTINIRAYSSAPTPGTGTQVSWTVDSTQPTDVTLTVTSSDQQNSLSWAPATDATPITQYDVRMASGTTTPPVNCSAGTSIYTGTSLSYPHTGLTNGVDYAYRVCATDTMGNTSVGATGTGKPVTGTPNIVTATSTSIASGSTTESTTNILMQRLTVNTSAVGGSDDKVVLSYITIDDNTASATQYSAVKIYIDPSSSGMVPTTAALIGGKSRWDGSSTQINLTGGTTSDRTVNAGTPKYVYIVYDMAFGQSTKTAQARITAVGVSGPDTSATGLTLTSNSLSLTAGTNAGVITACSGCHTYPPADATGGTPQRNTPAGAVVGSHAAHTSVCSECHIIPATTTSVDFDHRSGNIQFAGGIGYTRGNSFAQTNNISGTGLGTCTSTTCHADVYGAGPVSSPTWGTTAGCDACHSIAIGATGPATGGHALSGHNAACTSCHNFGTTATTSPSTAHADGFIDVVNVGYPASVAKHASGSGYSSCSNASCHGNVYGAGGGATPTWGSTGNGCGSCHSIAIGANGPDTGSHTSHAGRACTNCHNAGTTATSTPTTGHNNNNIDVTSGYPATVAKHAANTGYSSCSAATCHNAYGTTGIATPTWGSNATCGSCHTIAADGSPATGSHAAHMSKPVVLCNSCHAGAVKDASGGDAHVDNDIDVAAGGYPTNRAKHTAGSGYSTCSTTACHSDGKASPTYYTATWGNAASGACGTCHRRQDTNANMASAAPAVPPALTAAHFKHVGTDRYGLNTNYHCGACHAETTSDNNTILTANGKHVNLARDWKFGTFGGRDQSGGSYASSQCTNTYCHSKGRSTSAPFTAPVSNILWTAGAGSANCTTTCHGGATAAATVTTNGPFDSHVDHIATDTYVITCDQCHAETTAAGSSSALNATTGYTKHVNGTKDWKFASTLRGNAAVSQATGTYTFGGTDGSGTCANIYCHSKGTIMSSAPTATTYTGNHAPFQAATWNVTFGCNGCHGDGTYTNGMPNYTNGTPKANSHQAHTSYTCDKCHYAVTTTGTSIATSGYSLHINGTYNIANSASTLTYSMGALTGGIPAGGTCSGTGMVAGCHGNSGNFTWGATLQCIDCHGSSTADTDVFAAGTAGIINTTQWTSTGHGLASTSNYADSKGSPNPGAGFVAKAGTGQDACLWCHDKTIEHSLTSANPYRLRNNNALGNGWNDACLYCHDTNQTTAAYKPVAGFVTAINLANVTKIDKWHYQSSTDNATSFHAGTRDGGQLCWDCHDPHGDANIKMIHLRPIKDTVANAAGAPVMTTAVGANVSFTNNNLATGAGGFALTTGFTGGLCNACHTNSASAPKMVHYNATASDSHYSTTLCTQCHKHSGDTTNTGKAFEGAGACDTCHNAAQGTGGYRRQIVASTTGTGEFRTASATTTLFSHARNATAIHQNTCKVCHAASPHGNVADPNVPLQNTWAAGSLNYTGTAASLTYFCTGCHRSAGYGGTLPGGSATALAPFADSGDSTVPAPIFSDWSSAGQFTGTSAEPTAAISNPTGNTTVKYTHRRSAQCMDCHGDTRTDTTTTPKINAHASSNATFLRYPDEQQTCFNSSTGCHGSASTLTWPGAKVYNEFKVNNASIGTGGAHPVFQAVTPSSTLIANDTTGTTFVNGWKSNSVATCSDCHGGSSGTRGPHGSSMPFILKPAPATSPTQTTSGTTFAAVTQNTRAFCLNCHAAYIYGDGNGNKGAGAGTRVGHGSNTAWSGTSNCSGPLRSYMNNSCQNCHCGRGYTGAGGKGTHATNAEKGGATTHNVGFANGNTWAGGPWGATSSSGCYVLNATNAYSDCSKGMNHSGSDSRFKRNIRNIIDPLRKLFAVDTARYHGDSAVPVLIESIREQQRAIESQGRDLQEIRNLIKEMEP